jgi:hypothetical protein
MRGGGLTGHGRDPRGGVIGYLKSFLARGFLPTSRVGGNSSAPWLIELKYNPSNPSASKAAKCLGQSHDGFRMS